MEKQENKPQNQWKLNDECAWFIGENREQIRLTQHPEPCAFQHTVNWLNRQVSRSLKMVHEHDK
ncbi:MAG: replication initiation factor domain-containing protein [Beduini sp.]|uniref:replication initiation factor domain-containing protein n=1 Tax=Beduini sp. TaxID=1922300 RepID=UPI003990807E